MTISTPISPMNRPTWKSMSDMASLIIHPAEHVRLDMGEEGIVVTSHIGAADRLVGPEVRTVSIEEVQSSSPLYSRPSETNDTGWGKRDLA